VNARVADLLLSASIILLFAFALAGNANLHAAVCGPAGSMSQMMALFRAKSQTPCFSVEFEE